MWVPGKIISATAQRSARARRSMQPEQLRRALRDRAKSFFFQIEHLTGRKSYFHVSSLTSHVAHLLNEVVLKLFSNVYCAAHYFLV